MNVDAWSPSTLGVIEGCMGSIPVHFALSRDLYQSGPRLSLSPYAPLLNLFGGGRAQDDRQGVGATLKALHTTKTISREYGARCLAASDKLTSWLSVCRITSPALSRRRSASSGVASARSSQKSWLFT